MKKMKILVIKNKNLKNKKKKEENILNNEKSNNLSNHHIMKTNQVNIVLNKNIKIEIKKKLEIKEKIKIIYKSNKLVIINIRIKKIKENIKDIKYQIIIQIKVIIQIAPYQKMILIQILEINKLNKKKNKKRSMIKKSYVDNNIIKKLKMN